jgi:tryptophanyl-tRNA synthetase
LVPWVFAKWLQDKFDVNLYFQLTDDEKFDSKTNLTLEETKKFAYENALDFIALGFNPEKTKIRAFSYANFLVSSKVKFVFESNFSSSVN